MPFGSVLAGLKVVNILNNGYQAVKKAGGIKGVLQKGWTLAQKGANTIIANKNLGDAVVQGDIAVVDTPAGYLVTNKQGAGIMSSAQNILPWLLGGLGIYIITKK